MSGRYKDYFPMLVAWYGGKMVYLGPYTPISSKMPGDCEDIHYFLRESTISPLGDYPTPSREGVFKVQGWCELWFDGRGMNFNIQHPEYIKQYIVGPEELKGYE